MYIYESDFIYANEDSTLYGVMFCTIDNMTSSSNDEESNPILSTTAYKDTWDFHGLEKSSPLQFNKTIAKKDGTYFNAYEARAIKKWLCKGSFNWLQINQDDLSNVFYNCIFINPRNVSVGSFIAGIEFTVQSNSQYAWSKIYGQHKTYSSIGNDKINLFLDIDFDDYIVKPILKIKATSNGDIKIRNNASNTEVEFKNCTSNEEIILEGNTYRIKSSTGRIMVDDWNREILELCKGLNDISLTGNFTVQLLYRLPIRVGG